jgi:hypothetical protein
MAALASWRFKVFLGSGLGDWTFAAPPHLMRELRAGIPDGSQRTAYTTLQEAWSENAWSDDFQPDEGEIAKIEQSLSILKLKDAPDQHHLAEAIALNASWFLTNDKEVIRKANAQEAVQKTAGYYKESGCASRQNASRRFRRGCF